MPITSYKSIKNKEEYVQCRLRYYIIMKQTPIFFLITSMPKSTTEVKVRLYKYTVDTNVFAGYIILQTNLVKLTYYLNY